MLRNFVDWISRQLRVCPPKARHIRALLGAPPRRRRRSFEVFPRMESLEERVVPSAPHLFSLLSAYPVLEREENPAHRVSIYEDLTGDGYTPDDMLFPFQLPV